MKLLILFLVICCGQISPQDGPEIFDTYGKKVIEFQNVYGPYFRKLFGCPMDTRNPEDCRPNLGIRDYKLEEQVIEKAKVFTK